MNIPPNALLALAIALEVAGTSLLQASHHFTRLVPTIAMGICYGLAFWLLTIVLKYIPVGIAYAIWSGSGVAAIAFIGWAFFGQRLDLWAILGIGLIIVGVLVLNLLSGTVRH
ncbi:QacE family quaternary ammonium compound efflux SMR transporter [Paracoccus suum]|uniref:QacE family quaternary ammonium compound efflux SMR transporter n=1 Tax=Paracoccus suum TaxID=2259340 RepID=A0A344PLA5_9RHOB|nr:SMR family transporter [Paracoccus suum]AXC50160.1 QacE family quaternary ammonium compound efflux SMR transporter [Paracoccus suum]